MNIFRTIVSTTPSESKIDLKTAVFTLGSCFSDVIGSRLERCKIPVRVNPFGVIYNPVSIHQVLNYAIQNNVPDTSRYVKNQDIHLNYDFHSEFSSLRQNELVSQITHTLSDAHSFLKNTQWLIVTYGTAWVYQLKDSSRIVANCHKMPGSIFEKRLLNVEEIVRSFSETYHALTSINSNLRIVLTVSPVRHIKDTLERNSVSKSVLRVASHEITTAFSGVEYFPSFEMVIDDLRDYRFYKSDMIHPSTDAEDYIWDKFIARYCTDETRKYMEDLNKVLTALSHKPFHPTSEGHQRFLRETLKKLENLQDKINVDKEITFVKQQIR